MTAPQRGAKTVWKTHNEKWKHFLHGFASDLVVLDYWRLDGSSGGNLMTPTLVYMIELLILRLEGLMRISTFMRSQSSRNVLVFCGLLP